MELLIQAFGKCPACQDNLINMWCAYICDPYQGNFVVDEKVEDNFVLATSFSISATYAQAIYDSCKDVEVNGFVTRGNT